MNKFQLGAAMARSLKAQRQALRDCRQALRDGLLKCAKELLAAWRDLRSAWRGMLAIMQGDTPMPSMLESERLEADAKKTLKEGKPDRAWWLYCAAEDARKAEKEGLVEYNWLDREYAR